MTHTIEQRLILGFLLLTVCFGLSANLQAADKPKTPAAAAAENGKLVDPTLVGYVTTAKDLQSKLLIEMHRLDDLRMKQEASIAKLRAQQKSQAGKKLAALSSLVDAGSKSNGSQSDSLDTLLNQQKETKQRLGLVSEPLISLNSAIVAARSNRITSAQFKAVIGKAETSMKNLGL